MSLSFKYNEEQRVRSLPPVSSTFPCALYEATTVYPLEKERIIPYQEKSKSFLHRTLIKSSNKSMLIDQYSQMTLLMC